MVYVNINKAYDDANRLREIAQDTGNILQRLKGLSNELVYEYEAAFKASGADGAFRECSYRLCADLAAFNNKLGMFTDEFLRHCEAINVNAANNGMNQNIINIL